MFVEMIKYLEVIIKTGKNLGRKVSANDLVECKRLLTMIKNKKA